MSFHYNLSFLTTRSTSTPSPAPSTPGAACCCSAIRTTRLDARSAAANWKSWRNWCWRGMWWSSQTRYTPTWSTHPDRQHIPLASLGPETAARTVTLMSASKAFNIAGLRCAVAAFGSAELKRRFDAVPRQLLGGVGSPGLLAARVAWEKCQDWLDAVLRYLQGNRDFVARELPGVVQRRPEATYLSWLDCTALRLEPNPFRYFLDRGRVALSAGADFGSSFEGFVRLNFVTSRSILCQIVGRMKSALQ